MASAHTSPFGFNRELDSLFPSGTRIAFTAPPFSLAAPLNSLNAHLDAMSVMVVNSKPYRTSGLSLPYLLMASAYVIRGNGRGSVTSTPSLNAAHIKSSPRLKMPSMSLRELRLTVRAQVLVAEAARDLVVPVRARDHEHLFEELRRLRQRVARAGLQPRRDEIIPRALRGRPRQHRRLDLEEPVIVLEDAAQRADGLRAQPQVLHHPRPPQVQHAILQPNLLRRAAASCVVVLLSPTPDRERQRLPDDVQDVHLVRGDLYGAGGDLIVRRRARLDASAHAHDPLRSHRGERRDGARRRVRVRDHLAQTGVVAHVREDDAAHVALLVHPSAEGDDVADVGVAEVARGVRPRRPRELVREEGLRRGGDVRRVRVRGDRGRRARARPPEERGGASRGVRRGRASRRRGGERRGGGHRHRHRHRHRRRRRRRARRARFRERRAGAIRRRARDDVDERAGVSGRARGGGRAEEVRERRPRQAHRASARARVCRGARRDGTLNPLATTRSRHPLTT
eukprot:29149-Pelagococcus_subviridis.AAC.1